MTIKQATKELKGYNKWRRGADVKVAEPYIIIIAIDTVVEWVESELKNKSEKSF
jgi:hypothetical protein